jgi:hypothetical protein
MLVVGEVVSLRADLDWFRADAGSAGASPTGHGETR